MENIWGIPTVLFFVAGAVYWSRICRPARVVEWVIFPFVFLGSQIVAAGLVLSAFNQLASGFWWGISGLVLFSLSVVTWVWRRGGRDLFPPSRSPAIGVWWRALPAREKRILGLILATVAAAGVLNSAVVLFTAPHTWDSMAYRLARTAYYLQQGHLGYFDANYVQQVAVQKNCSLLMLFSLVVSSRNENLVQLWQMLAYWTAAAAVFGIARETGRRRSAALISAGIFALLPLCLAQSTTAQSDMILAALAGAAVYALFAYRRRPHCCLLLVSALAIGMGAGVKASFGLLLPSLLLVIAYIFSRFGRAFGIRGLVRFVGLIIPAVLILTLPAAYFDNYRLFHHPLGPEEFRKTNSYEGKPMSFVLPAGGKHLLRSGFDFLSLDGLPPLPAVWKIQNAIRYPPQVLTGLAGLNLEEGLVNPWYYYPPPHSHEDYSSWGIMGWALIWPALLLAAGRGLKRRAAGIVALAALVFIVAHAFTGVYDFHGRARYLLPATVLALPAAGWWFEVRSRTLKIWLWLFISLGCLSALSAVLFRYRSPVWFDGAVWLRGRLNTAQEESWPLPVRTDSVFLRDRLGQLLRDGPVFAEAIANYERIVPRTAAVAAALNPNSMEYPLFGSELTRRITPLNSFHRGLQPIPEESDYLLWADDFDEIFDRRESDVYLGKDWWLRRLR